MIVVLRPFADLSVVSSGSPTSQQRSRRRIKDSGLARGGAVMVGIVDRDWDQGSMGAKGKGGGNVKEQEYAKMEGTAIAPKENGEWHTWLGSKYASATNIVRPWRNSNVEVERATDRACDTCFFFFFF